jgi:hypothetical protein
MRLRAETSTRPCAKSVPARNSVVATLSRGGRFARPALVDGAVGAVLAPRGRLFRVLAFSIAGGKIVAIGVVGDPVRLGELELAVLDR